VQGFFVLSGFVITNLIIRDIYDGSGFDVFRFLKRRFLKIVPAFYFVSFITVFLLPHLAIFSSSPSWNTLPIVDSKGYRDTVIALPYFLGFVGNLAYSLDWAAPPTPALLMGWTLAVEEQFYLVVALLFACSGVIKFKCSAKVIVTCLLSLILFSLLFRIHYLTSDQTGFAIPTNFVKIAYTHTLSQMDSIASGCLVALLFNFSPHHVLRVNKGWSIAVGLLFLFCVATFLGEKWVYTVGLTIINTFWGVIVLIIAKRSNLQPLFFGNALARIGKNGYCLYLVHHIAILIAVSVIDLRNGAGTDWAFFTYFARIATTLLISLILAEILLRTTEKPLRKFR
ncbi:MAG: acyltransferase, partial [Proteobacteria bacterium]|nr:acyltransferase [Pseudomonadota bacterium]